MNLVPPVFLLNLVQLFPLDHTPLLPEAPLPLVAAMRDHQDLHSKPPEVFFTSKSNGRIIGIQQVTIALGISLAGKFS